MKKYLSLLLIICLSIIAQAQVDRSKAPVAGPAPKVQIGEIESFTLKNGLKVLVVENHKLPQISFSMNIIRDALVEGEKAGYTNIAGELWGKATKKRDVKKLSEEVDFIGSILHTSSTSVNMSGLSKYTEEIMELFADVLLNPAFPQEEFDKIILQSKSALTANSTSPGYILSNISTVNMFGPQHPYGEIMTEQTLSNTKLEDCVDYYKNYVFPNNSILVIVGDISLKKAKALTSKYLSKWEKGNAPHFEYATPAQPKGTEVIFSNKDAANQASIMVAYPIDLKIGAEDIIAVSVMNSILGGGNFEAKLFKNLREDKGYTYGAYSSISSNVLKGSGSFKASSEVKADIVDSALIEIFKEMQNMLNSNFSEEDIIRTQKDMTGSFSRSLEHPGTVANFAYQIERYGLPKDYYETYLERVAKVTKEDVVNAAKKYLHPDNAYIFVVTDRSQKEKLAKLSSNGVVKEVDSEGKPLKEGAKIAEGITAGSIIDTYLKAIGGQDKIKEMKDMSVTTETSIQGMTMVTNSEFLITEKPVFKIEVSMAGNVMQKIIFDGEKAEISGMGGSQTLEGEQVEALKQQAYPILEAEYNTIGITPTLEGVESVNGRDAYKIKVVVGNNTTYSFYDVENGLKVKSVGMEAGQTQEIFFEDYKQTDFGIIYPFLSKSSMQGMPLETKVTDLKFNTGLKL